MSGRKCHTLKTNAEGDAFIEVAGRRIPVIDADAAERVDFIVCGPTSYFADDVKTHCALCRAPIVHRPSAPVAPLKICLECMVSTAKAKREESSE
jgi:hypothetical protein